MRKTEISPISGFTEHEQHIYIHKGKGKSGKYTFSELLLLSAGVFYVVKYIFGIF